MTTVSLKKVFSNNELYPLLYHLALLNKYGVEYYDWDPETIRSEIREDFNIEITDIVSNKIQAISTLVSTDHYYLYWEAFESLTKAIVTGYPQFVHITPLYPEEICWGLITACLNDSEYDSIKDLPFSLEVIGYITVTLEMQGIYSPPDFIIDMPFEKKVPAKNNQNLKLKIIFMARTLLSQIKEYFPQIQEEVKDKLKAVLKL